MEQVCKIISLLRIFFFFFFSIPRVLNNRETATLVMLALVFDWNLAGFNDVASVHGVAGQNRAAIIANLVANDARNYNNVVFTFPNGTAIGAWIDQICVNIPWYE